VCIVCAKEDPAQLDMGVPSSTSAALVLEGAAAEVMEQQVPLTAGLASYQRVPKSPGGTLMIKDNLKLFDHMVGFARRQTVPGEQLVPSAAVGDVEMRPDTKEEPGGQRRSVLNPSEQDYTLGAIMKAAGGGGGLVAGPKRKLDAIAAVRGHSGLLNDEKCLRRLRAQLDLAQSVSEIKSQERLAKKAKTEAATGELFDVAPRALTKLRSKGGDVTKLFKNEVHAIAYRYFATTLDGKLKSGYLTAALEELIKSRSGVLDAVVLEAEAAGVAAVGAVVAGATAGAAAAAVAALPPWGGHGGGGGQ